MNILLQLFEEPPCNLWRHSSVIVGNDVKFFPLCILFFVMSSGVTPLQAQPDFWREASGGFPIGDATSLALSSTGDIFVGSNAGIYRSTDDGNSWKRLTREQTRSIAVHPEGTVYASWCSDIKCGLYKSTDNGTTWEAVDPGNSNAPVDAIAIREDGLVVLASNQWVYQSTDDGTTWSGQQVVIGDETITSLGVAPGFVFAGVTDFSNPSGYATLRRSTDDGASWTVFSPEWSLDAINAITRHPNGDAFVATNLGIRISTNGGASWSLVTGFDYPVTAIAVNPAGYVFAGTGDRSSATSTGGGIFRSTNLGGTWVQANTGISNSNIYSLAVNVNGTLYAGSSRSGVFRSPDAGATWLSINRSIFTTGVTAFTGLAGGGICAATSGDGVFISYDNGDTWDQHTNGLPSAFLNTVHQSADGIVFAGLNSKTDGIARSSDEGISWSSSSAGLAADRVLSFTSKAGGIVIAGLGDGVARSTNNGAGWEAGGSGPSGFVRTLLTMSNGTIVAGSEGGVHMSTDNGVSWTGLNSGLTNTLVRALVFDHDNNWFAGTGGGVFRSTDNGLSWFPANSGIPTFEIIALGVAASNDLFASTDSGVFHTTNQGSAWEPLNAGLPTLNPKFISVLCFGTNPKGYLFTGLSGAFFSSNPEVYRSTASLWITQQYNVAEGWNMVSLPLLVENDSVKVVFPTALSDAFEFSGTYIPRKRLGNGPGYWVKFSEAQITPVTGTPIVADTIAVNEGWNIIGSVASAIDTAAVIDIPDGTVTSPYYAFENGYSIRSTIEPGRAYWVKCSQAGNLVLISAGQARGGQLHNGAGK